jgi:hypothetical protein
MKRLLSALLVLLVLPGSALAQPPDWTLKLQLAKPVFLTTQAGERVEGVTGQITPDAIVVSTPAGIREVRYRELRRAEKRDALWTGAAIGAATGATLGIGVAVNSDCGDSRQCSAEKGGVVAAGALYGALIGWGLDALVKGKTTLFEAESTTRVSVAQRRGGMQANVALTW